MDDSTGASSAPEVAAPAVAEAPSLRASIESLLTPAETRVPAEAPTLVPTEQPKPAETVAAPAVVDDADGVVDDFELDLDGQPADPALPSAEAEADATEAQAGDLSKEEADKEIGRILATPRGRRIYAAHKAAMELAKPEDAEGGGGIGHVPTVDQTRQYFASHLGMQRLISDWSSGDPQRHGKVAEYFFGPGSSPQIAANFLTSLPEHIQATNPQLLPALVNPIGEGIAHHIRSLAPQYAEADQARLRDAADILDMIQGRQPQAQPGQQANGTEDPEKTQLRQRLQQMTEAQQRNQQNAAAQMGQRVRTAIYQRVEGQLVTDVDKALAIVKGKVDDIIYDGFKSRLTEELRSTIKAARQPIEAIRLRVEDAIARGARQEDVDAITREYRRIWANKLTDSRGAYIRAAGVRLKQDASAATAKLQQAQSRTEPTAAGARPPDHPAPLTRRDGESMDQFRSRAIAYRLASVQ